MRRFWKRKGREAEEEQDRWEDRVAMDRCAGCALLKGAWPGNTHDLNSSQPLLPGPSFWPD